MAVLRRVVATLDVLCAAQAEAMLVAGTSPPDQGRARKRAAFLRGFSLHAGVHLHANDRAGLTHLCGYGARPPFSQERLSALPDGRLAYRLRRSLGDGRQMLLLQPTELLRRLATLVPPPRAHLLRYHGVFAPSARWRREVVPRPLTAAEHRGPAAVPSEGESTSTAPAPRPRSPCRIPWAELLLRVFREEVLACPCGGRRVVLAYLTEPGSVRAILDHLGLPSTGPPLAPARFTVSPSQPAWQDDVSELQRSLR